MTNKTLDPTNMDNTHLNLSPLPYQTPGGGVGGGNPSLPRLPTQGSVISHSSNSAFPYDMPSPVFTNESSNKTNQTEQSRASRVSRASHASSRMTAITNNSAQTSNTNQSNASNASVSGGMSDNTQSGLKQYVFLGNINKNNNNNINNRSILLQPMQTDHYMQGTRLIGTGLYLF